VILKGGEDMEHSSFVKTDAINRRQIPWPKAAVRPGANAMAIATKHVLIADDDLLIQKTLKFHLEESGYTVGLAKNGQEAICYIEARRPSTVLLDVFMPESDGLEALLKVKKQFPDIKVIVMSGGGIKGHYEFLTMAKKFGADAVLRKPIHAHDLLTLLEMPGPVVES
jgi:CheY-like chemotaxis protein